MITTRGWVVYLRVAEIAASAKSASLSSLLDGCANVLLPPWVDPTYRRKRQYQWSQKSSTESASHGPKPPSSISSLQSGTCTWVCWDGNAYIIVESVFTVAFMLCEVENYLNAAN